MLVSLVSLVRWYRIFLSRYAACIDGIHRLLQISWILRLCVYDNLFPHKKSIISKYAIEWQNQQNDLCARWRLRSAWTYWSVFAVRMNKSWILSYPLSAQLTPNRLGGCPGWSESSLDAYTSCNSLLVLSYSGSNYFEYDLCILGASIPNS